MTQDSHRPEVIIGHPPPSLKILRILQNLAKLFLHNFFDASQTTPKATFGTKNNPKVAPKNTQNDKKIAL